MERICITGIGQDSHRFLTEVGKKKCRIGGVTFEDVPGLDADSDGDVILHSLCNAITSITHVPILGKKAIEMCKCGITDSAKYLEEALKSLDGKILHIAFTMEGARPRMQKRMDEVRETVAKMVGIEVSRVGMTVTSGDHMTAFGRGEGLMAYCALSVHVKK